MENTNEVTMPDPTLDEHPEVRAARAKVQRQVALAKIAAAFPSKRQGEVPLLRKNADQLHALLVIYDPMDAPPDIARQLARTFDRIIARLHLIADAERAAAESKAAAKG